MLNKSINFHINAAELQTLPGHTNTLPLPGIPLTLHAAFVVLYVDSAFLHVSFTILHVDSAILQAASAVLHGVFVSLQAVVAVLHTVSVSLHLDSAFCNLILFFAELETGLFFKKIKPVRKPESFAMIIITK